MKDNFKAKMMEYEQMYLKTFMMPRKKKKRERKQIKELSVALIWVFVCLKEKGFTL